MGVEGKDIFIGLILIGLFMFSFGYLVGDIGDTYGVELNESFDTGIYNKINETYSTTRTMTDETRGIGINSTTGVSTDEERYYRVLRNSLTSVLMIFGALDYIPAMVSDIGGKFYIHPIFITSIIAILTFIILWAIWKILHRS